MVTTPQRTLETTEPGIIADNLITDKKTGGSTIVLLNTDADKMLSFLKLPR